MTSPINEPTDWYAANQAFLAAEIAGLKRLLQPDADSPPSRGDASAFASRPPALEFLTAIFDLSAFERLLLMMCAAPELDPDCARLYAVAQGDAGRLRPSFGLALATLPGAHWSALAPNGPLRRWRLIEIDAGTMLTSAALRIDERILHFLLGVDHPDERIAHLIRRVPETHRRQLAPSHAGICAEIAALWSSAITRFDMPLVQLVGDVDDCRPIFAAAAHECGTQAAVLSAEHAPSGGAELDALLRLWEREARLAGLGVLVIEYDDAVPASSQLLQRLPGRVVLCTRHRAVVNFRAALTVDVRHPTAAEQRLVWGHALRLPLDDLAVGGAVQLDAIATQFDLSVKAIRSAAANAISSSPEQPLTAAWNVCRTFLRDRMEGLAQRVESRAEWPDLVLPQAETEILHAIVAQVRQRRTVHETWGFAGKCARGLGTSVLFAGPSGTGKTLAAEVLANEMHLDLYRIDLSSVVSKYIGESEKALRRVFDAAEDSGAILLFDEADALFGVRSQVKDSHDRYANIQVSYLLQRMEDYRGLAILTTNQKSALDNAFMRRLRFVVQFPFPEVEQRCAIWSAVFPVEAPLDQLDPKRLAQLNVPGGNIRNIAMNAAFLAAEEHRSIAMRDVLAATRAEYGKLERTLTAAETTGWL